MATNAACASLLKKKQGQGEGLSFNFQPFFLLCCTYKRTECPRKKKNKMGLSDEVRNGL